MDRNGEHVIYKRTRVYEIGSDARSECCVIWMSYTYTGKPQWRLTLINLQACLVFNTDGY